jgi:hypothetical protein
MTAKSGVRVRIGTFGGYAGQVARRGRPGIAVEPALGSWPESPNILVVSRDSDGLVDGVMRFGPAEVDAPVSISIVVDYDRRRTGVASRIYDWAAAAGIPIAAVSGVGLLTDDGRAFARAWARRARRKP